MLMNRKFVTNISLEAPKVCWSLLVLAVNICHSKQWTLFSRFRLRDFDEEWHSLSLSSTLFLYCGWHVHFFIFLKRRKFPDSSPSATFLLLKYMMRVSLFLAAITLRKKKLWRKNNFLWDFNAVGWYFSFFPSILSHE